MKNRIIEEFNKLGIPDMGKIEELHEGKGDFVNLSFPLPNGLEVKFWDDEKTYYINQIEKEDCDRCYGLTADENYLLVCEYGCNGSNPEIIMFKKWN